jgi:DNA adenine methylase
MKSLISYLGGKSLLAQKIIPFIPDHKCYCEVFAGAAWLLFKKNPSNVEILNDINSDLVTLYRVVKHHLDEFVRYFRWELVSRDEFERLKGERPETLTDIQRAARFYYLLRNGYASRIANPNFSVAATGRPRFNLLRMEDELSAVHLRLSRVYIENMHYDQFIRRFDKFQTFFYIDPPYYGCENDYGKGIFRRNDFKLLKDILVSIKGKFIMSINNTPEIRNIYEGFRIRKIQTTYTASGADKKKRVMELLIMNY